ncbi:MAG: rRNA maturation RNase YbeY [Cyanobacteria bacterium Co-bin13]|nr:rRNA maturation RNase YbeY [Cyanobacteria bacterium Co-bin13]
MVAVNHPLAALAPQDEALTLATEPIATDAEWQHWFTAWLEALQVNASPIDCYEVGLQFTDDAAMQQLNATYRQQDKPTDVLAFAALEDTSPQVQDLLQTEPLYLGDIIISLDTAQRQAAEQGHSLRHEAIWLSVHGFLHLLGWDHPDDESLIKMLEKQADLLGDIGVMDKKSS